MPNLYSDFLALTMCELDDPLQRFHLRILSQSAVLWRYTTFGCHCCSLDHGKTWSLLDNAAQMSEMPGRMMTIFSGILAKRRELKHVSLLLFET